MSKLLTYCIFMMSVVATAQVSFKAVVGKTEIKTDERVQLSYVITTEEDINISEVSFPNFRGFQVLGRNSGTNMSYSNGKMIRQFVESVVLFPQKAGKFTIGPAKVKINGEKVESNPITITVSKQEKKPNDNRGYASVVKMALVLSKDEVYPNEAIIADVKLYAKSYDLLRRRSDIEVPGISGFQVKKISENQEREFRQEVIDNRVFVSEEIAKFQFVPTQTGDLEIPEFKIRLAIPLDIFEEQIVLLKTEPKTIRVKELPKNAPVTFNGAIGDFKLNIGLDNREFLVEKPINYEIELIGEGILSSVQLPELNLPSELEVYPPKRRNAYQQTLTGEKGKIVDSYVIVPQYGGTYTIPELSFTFFSPETERYETITEPAREITVNGKTKEQIQASEQEEDNPEEIEKDSANDSINTDTIQKRNNTKTYIKLPDLPKLKEKVTCDERWYWLLLIPLIGIILYFLFKKKQTNKTVNTTQPKIDKSVIKADLQEALVQLKTAENHNDIDQFTQQSSLILNDIVRLYSTDAEQITYTQSQASAILSDQVSDTFLQKWENLFMKNQLMRYSGVVLGDSLEQLYGQYKELINESMKKAEEK